VSLLDPDFAVQPPVAESGVEAADGHVRVLVPSDDMCGAKPAALFV
jgi:hypothetical protein